MVIIVNNTGTSTLKVIPALFSQPLPCPLGIHVLLLIGQNHTFFSQTTPASTISTPTTTHTCASKHTRVHIFSKFRSCPPPSLPLPSRTPTSVRQRQWQRRPLYHHQAHPPSTSHGFYNTRIAQSTAEFIERSKEVVRECSATCSAVCSQREGMVCRSLS